MEFTSELLVYAYKLDKAVVLLEPLPLKTFTNWFPPFFQLASFTEPPELDPLPILDAAIRPSLR